MKIQKTLTEAAGVVTFDEKDYYSIRTLSDKDLDLIMKSFSGTTFYDNPKDSDNIKNAKEAIKKIISSKFKFEFYKTENRDNVKHSSVLKLAGMGATLLFVDAIKKEKAYQVFLSFFSSGSKINVEPNDKSLSYELIDNFAQAIGVKNLKMNKFIELFASKLSIENNQRVFKPANESSIPVSKEDFEDVYNAYAYDESGFNEKAILKILSSKQRNGKLRKIDVKDAVRRYNKENSNSPLNTKNAEDIIKFYNYLRNHGYEIVSQ